MHFTVMVKVSKECKTPEEASAYAIDALAPFQENNMGDCPSDYLELSVEIFKEDYATQAQEIRDKDLQKYIQKSDKEVLMDYHGYSEENEEGLGYYSNPNSMWDWYVIGGRWGGMLQVKKGCQFLLGERSAFGSRLIDEPQSCDIARINDIDWEAVDRAYNNLSHQYWKEAHEKEGDEKFRKAMYEIEPGDTEETYVARRKSPFSASAVLTLDGEWLDDGAGWGENKTWIGEFKAKFIDNENPKTWIVIVDCHI